MKKYHAPNVRWRKRRKSETQLCVGKKVTFVIFKHWDQYHDHAIQLPANNFPWNCPTARPRQQHQWGITTQRDNSRKWQWEENANNSATIPGWRKVYLCQSRVKLLKAANYSPFSVLIHELLSQRPSCLFRRRLVAHALFHSALATVRTSSGRTAHAKS